MKQPTSCFNELALEEQITFYMRVQYIIDTFGHVPTIASSRLTYIRANFIHGTFATYRTLMQTYGKTL